MAGAAPAPTPTGWLDKTDVHTASSSAVISARGWAVDLLDPSKPISVRVNVDGPNGSHVSLVDVADIRRDDIAKAYAGAGANHGFSIPVTVNASGTYKVCAFALGLPRAQETNPLLVCKTVTVGKLASESSATAQAAADKAAADKAAADSAAAVKAAADAAAAKAAADAAAVKAAADAAAAVKAAATVTTAAASMTPIAVAPRVTTAVGSVKPSASNTGVLSGTTLKKMTGDIVVTVPGTVIENIDLRGLIRVEAPNVTIRNSIVRGRPVTSSAALIFAGSPKAAGLVVEDTELVAADSNPWINGIMGSGFTVRRTEIANVVDTVHIFGDNVRVESSWLHDNLHFAKDPNWGGGPSHDDSVQVQKGNNISIVGNSITGAYNAALQVTQDAGVTSGLTFSKNWTSGGACTVNVAQKARGAIRGFTMTDNTFGASRFSCPAIIDTATKNVSTISGNTFSGGAFKIVLR